jgi:hypothetical protein
MLAAAAAPARGEDLPQRVESGSPVRADAGRALFSQGPGWLQMLDNQHASGLDGQVQKRSPNPWRSRAIPPCSSMRLHRKQVTGMIGYGF